MKMEDEVYRGCFKGRVIGGKSVGRVEYKEENTAELGLESKRFPNIHILYKCMHIGPEHVLRKIHHCTFSKKFLDDLFKNSDDLFFSHRPFLRSSTLHITLFPFLNSTFSRLKF